MDQDFCHKILESDLISKDMKWQKTMRHRFSILIVKQQESEFVDVENETLKLNEKKLMNLFPH